MIKKYLGGGLGVLLLILFDQWTKQMAASSLKDKANFTILHNVFELEYLENRGAAFGILQNQRWPLLLLTLLIFVVLCIVYYRIPTGRRFLPLQLVTLLIGAGAVGNMIDRFIKGYVVDFFYFSLIDFPVFNVADCYVVVGVCLACLLTLFYYKEEELEALWGTAATHRNEDEHAE